MPDRTATTDEVKRLTDICGLAPGTVTTWEALEEILAPLTRKDRRFRTIYRAWIAHMRKWYNRKVIVVQGVGLRILHEHERADDVRHTLARTTTYVVRAKTDVDDIQIAELTTAQVDDVHHVRMSTHRLHRALLYEQEHLRTRPVMPGPSPTMPAVRLGVG